MGDLCDHFAMQTVRQFAVEHGGRSNKYKVKVAFLFQPNSILHDMEHKIRTSECAATQLQLRAAQHLISTEVQR